MANIPKGFKTRQEWRDYKAALARKAYVEGRTSHQRKMATDPEYAERVREKDRLRSQRRRDSVEKVELTEEEKLRRYIRRREDIIKAQRKRAYTQRLETERKLAERQALKEQQAQKEPKARSIRKMGRLEALRSWR